MSANVGISVRLDGDPRRILMLGGFDAPVAAFAISLLLRTLKLFIDDESFGARRTKGKFLFLRFEKSMIVSSRA